MELVNREANLLRIGVKEGCYNAFVVAIIVAYRFDQRIAIKDSNSNWCHVSLYGLSEYEELLLVKSN